MIKKIPKIMQVTRDYIKNMFPAFSTKKGSASIILAAMLSGSILSTIFYSQQNAGWFLSNTEEHQKELSDQLTIKYAFTLGGYLVANNLILCRENGWESSKKLCKWNNDQQISLSEFALTNPTYSKVDGRNIMTFTGTLPSSIGKHKYKIKFDLVNWKDYKHFIGDIPNAICRNKDNLEIIPEGRCSDKQQYQCKDAKENDISNSVCEYISSMDEDYYIVLMSVTPVRKDAQTVHAGIRRPLAHITVQTEGNPNCKLTCTSSITAYRYPECRGEFQPPTSKDYAVVRIKIFNHGPGTLYSLSLLREEISATEVQRDPNTNKPILDDDGLPVRMKYISVTEDYLAGTQQALHPGQSMLVENQMACHNEVKYNIVSSFETTVRTQIAAVQRGAPWSGTPPPVPSPQVIDSTVSDEVTFSSSVNIHAQDYSALAYMIDSIETPTGVCVENTAPPRKQIAGSCPTKYSTNQSCGPNNKGICLYSHIEPRRLFFPEESKTDFISLKKSTTTYNFNLNVKRFITVLIRVFYPH